MNAGLKRIIDEHIKDCGIERVYQNIHLYQSEFTLYIEQQYRNHLEKTLTKL